MAKAQIRIDRDDLLKAVEELLHYADDNNYGVFVRDDGTVICASVSSTDGADHEVLNGYGLKTADENDNYPGDDNYDYAGCADWVVNGTNWVKKYIDDEYFNGERMEIEIILTDE